MGCTVLTEDSIWFDHSRPLERSNSEFFKPCQCFEPCSLAGGRQQLQSMATMQATEAGHAEPGNRKSAQFQTFGKSTKDEMTETLKTSFFVELLPFKNRHIQNNPTRINKVLLVLR